MNIPSICYNHHRAWFLRVFLFILVTLMVLLMPKSYAQTYDVSVKGVKAGAAQFQYQLTETAYSVSLSLFPNAMAKMLGVDDMREQASGVIQQGQLQPQNYRRLDIANQPEKTLLEVGFNGQTVTIQSVNDSGQLVPTEQFKLDKRGQDPLSQILQIRQDIATNQLQNTYTLVTENNQRLYHATLSSQNQAETMVQLHEANDGHRQLNLWFDSNGHLLKMQKIKRGKVDFEITKQ